MPEGSTTLTLALTCGGWWLIPLGGGEMSAAPGDRAEILT
jgi:hypothetical protein